MCKLFTVFLMFLAVVILHFIIKNILLSYLFLILLFS